VVKEKVKAVEEETATSIFAGIGQHSQSSSLKKKKRISLKNFF